MGAYIGLIHNHCKLPHVTGHWPIGTDSFPTAEEWRAGRSAWGFDRVCRETEGYRTLRTLGSAVAPIRYSSMPLAASRPSAMAHTTSD